MYTTEVITSQQKAEEICASLRNFYTGIIGFDTETNHLNLKTDAIDVIQFYVPPLQDGTKGRVLIFHVAAMVSARTGRKELPESLSKILTSKRIVKACSAPENDAGWIRKSFGIGLLGTIDIQSVALLRGETACGLDDLAAKFVPHWTRKADTKFAKWDAQLTDKMIAYAADDAYASYAVLQALNPEFCRLRIPSLVEPSLAVEEICRKALPLTRGLTSPHKVMRRILEQTAEETTDENYQRCLGNRVYDILAQRGVLSCVGV